jgi:hypothetical protein
MRGVSEKKAERVNSSPGWRFKLILKSFLDIWEKAFRTDIRFCRSTKTLGRFAEILEPRDYTDLADTESPYW